VARALSVDTSFLVDLQRERLRGERGPAHQALDRVADAALYCSVIVLGEYAQGFADPDDPAVQLLRNAVELLPVDEAVARRWAVLARTLRATGAGIGSNDLWIAATSLEHGLPLLSADHAAFARVPELELLPYR
jgi:predicted nucleic acid-binding protein